MLTLLAVRRYNAHLKIEIDATVMVFEIGRRDENGSLTHSWFTTTAPKDFMTACYAALDVWQEAPKFFTVDEGRTGVFKTSVVLNCDFDLHFVSALDKIVIPLTREEVHEIARILSSYWYDSEMNPLK